MDTTPIFKASNFNLFLTKIKELKGAQGPFKNQILMHNNRIAEIKVNDAYNLITLCGLNVLKKKVINGNWIILKYLTV